MKHNSLYIIFMMTTLLMVAVGCQPETDLIPRESEVKEGNIVLSLSDIEVFTTDAVTRSEYDANNPDNYTFTLSGKTKEGEDVANLPVTFKSGVASVPAGDYTLTATTRTDLANGIPGVPTYTKTTESSFKIETGQNTPVTLNMGSPTNSKVTLAQDDTFSAKYESVQVTLTKDNRSIDLGTVSGCYAVAYFPAGSVSYTITASAISGSHVTDINGTTGSITLTAGHHTVLTLTANSVSGEIITIIDGEHNGEFDTKEYRPLN
jgi:hypothetical protein